MDSTNLKWLPWRGNLPPYAVSITNYKGRTDYVCKSGDRAGFYTPSKGSYCFYPWGGNEQRVDTFEILVNEGNLENLVWKGGSYGKVPENSVKSGSGLYVGRNKYGLGKVDVGNTAFFLPWEGKETWYKHYEVLTFDTDILSQTISNVKYNTEQMKISQVPPEVIVTSSVDNHGSSPVKETVKLEKTLQVQKSWDFSSDIKLGVSTTMTAGVPDVASVGVQYSVETTFQFSQGTTKTESKSYSLSVEVTVPPKSLCSVRMVGNKSSADIPFTAHVTRKYRCGKTTSGSISGYYRGVDVVDVKSVVDPCTPI